MCIRDSHYTVRDSSVSQNAMTQQKAESIELYPQFIERFLQQTPDSEMFREDIVYIKFQAYLILLLKNSLAYIISPLS